MKARFALLLCAFAAFGGRAFAQCPTAAPAIQSPADGAQNVFANPTLTWSAVSGANQYDVYFGVAGSGACTGTPQFTTANTSFNPPTLAASTSYEWRVVAKKTTPVVRLRPAAAPRSRPPQRPAIRPARSTSRRRPTRARPAPRRR